MPIADVARDDARIRAAHDVPNLRPQASRT
jgi:hypothetical protein